MKHKFIIICVGALISHSISFASGRTPNNADSFNSNRTQQQSINPDSVPAQRPGAGTAIYFDGISQHANLSTAVLANATKFTIEFWIKTTENRSSDIFWQRPTMIGNETVNAPSNDFGITTDNGRVGMWSGLNYHGDNFMLTNTSINDNRWHHIAAVNNGEIIVLYVDGILQNGHISSGLKLITTYYALSIGASNSFNKNGAGFYHQGLYDEVRMWDAPLSTQEIRDRMCHKISPSDSLYSHLVAYYNFDDVSTYSTFDVVTHEYDAELKKWPQRGESGAPIGDTSVNAYMYSSDAKSLTITAASGETLQVTTSLGRNRGLHLFVVNENPLDTAGIKLLCTQNKYFGIFSVAKGDPLYSATYNYSSNNCVTITNENNLRIYEKPYLGQSDWLQLPYSPDAGTGTITISGVHRYNARFILGIDSTSNAISNNTDLIKSTTLAANITLSPNPASAFLYVQLNSLAKEDGAFITRIVDQNDKEVWKSLTPQNNLVIDVHAFAQGVYFIQFVSHQGTVTKKFIVSR